MESAIAPCVELTNRASSPMARRIKLFREFKHNLDVLKGKEEEVVAKECDIREKLRNAEEERKQAPFKVVKLWLKKVEEAKTRVSNIEISSQRILAHSCFSKFWKRIKLSKLAEKEINELDCLLGKEFPGGLVADAPAETAILFDPPPLHGQPTVEKTMDEIMKLLLDSPEVGKIGVYGMGGVGKTTMMMNINNKLAEMMKTNGHFDKIIWVTVSKEVGGIREIQQKIAQELGEEFGTKLSRWDDEVRRAAALLGELKSIGKFLIILDDLWKKITLQEVGIPQPNKDNDCKVLVTTRNLNVCDSIETQKNVQVECLSDQEAWDLFASKLSDHVLANPKFRDVAKQVVRECGGLPLGINTIGCAMRRRQNIEQWEHALNELRRSTTGLGMGEEVFKLLRFSYNNLKSQVFRKCFLYCAFFPEDDVISEKELIEHWVAEGYTEEGIDDQYDNWDRKAEMNKGFQILEELKDACMLEISQITDKGVRMHDLVRDLAINIMREDFGFLAKAGLQLEELPKEQWESANKISLIATKMVNFPKQLNCPSLTTLLLQREYRSLQIDLPLSRKLFVDFPPCFFSQMPTLRVLNLSNRMCEELPASLSNLVSLRYLNLFGSRIRELPPEVGKLLNLRYLNLSFTRIRELPHEMGELLNLRYLNLRGTKIRELPRALGALFRLRFLDLTQIPLLDIDFNLLSKLTLLADLSLELVGLQNIQEITHLRCLKSLYIFISDYKDYLEVVKHVPWDLVKSFTIEFTQGGTPSMGKIAKAKVVIIQKFDICNELSSFCLPKNTEWLQLFGCKIPPLSRIQCLKELRLLKVLEFVTISVSGNILVRGEEMEPNALASCEDLTFSFLKKCKYIIQGKLPGGCLANLKFLHITHCGWLKSLFSFQILSHLNKIERISLYHCYKIEEIVGDCDEDNLRATTTKDIIILPNLRELRLEGLPKLKSISRKTTWVCDSLIKLSVNGCTQIEARLPFKKNLGAHKCNIYGSRDWWEALQCDDAETKTLFQFTEITTEEASSDEESTEVDDEAESESIEVNNEAESKSTKVDNKAGSC